MINMGNSGDYYWYKMNLKESLGKKKVNNEDIKDVK